MLEEIAKGLWVYNQPLKLIGVHIGHRMTVVRLPDGGLWVHSPVELTTEIRQKIDRLGTVSQVVAPSCMHDMYLDRYRNTYPQATLHAVPGLQAILKDISFDETLGVEPPEAWGGAFEQLPVAGMPKINEFVFLHRASRSLIVADLVFNIPDRGRWWDRMMWSVNGKLYGRLGTSRLFNSMVQDREAFTASMRRILEWDFDRIIVGHGDIVETEGKTKLERALRDTAGLNND